MGQGGGAVGRFDRRLQEAVDIAGAAFGDAVLHPVQRAGDALQQIVEVMGDAAGELAHRFHLLRLAQAVPPG